MSMRAILVVLLAILCGVSAVIGMSRFRGSITPVVQAAETTPVVVATADVGLGNIVTSEVLELRDWPKDHVPPGALTKIEDAVERAVMSRIVIGEPILDAKLASIDAGRGIAALIPADMRAFTINTPQVAANVAGFVLPNNHVDILLNLRGGVETGGGSTTTLLQAVKILAVDQRLDAPEENKVDNLRSVTLLVTPEQAALLALGQTAGTLTLSLRNDEDMAYAKTAVATLNDIRMRQEKPLLLEEPTEKDADQRVPWYEALVTIATAVAKSQPRLPMELEPPDDDEPKVLEIRTLRGLSRGLVYVTQRPN